MISARPASATTFQRSFVSRSTILHTSQTSWKVNSFQRGYASEGKASPTDATTTGETVPTEAEPQNEPAQTEPSQSEQKQHIVEESVSTNAAREPSASRVVQEKAQQAKEGIQNAASSVAGAFGARGTQSGRSDHSARDGAQTPGKILYVGNLFFEVKAESLAEEFSQFGNVVNSRIVTDGNGLSRG